MREVLHQLPIVWRIDHDQSPRTGASLSARDISRLQDNFDNRAIIRYAIDNQRVISPHFQCEQDLGATGQLTMNSYSSIPGSSKEHSSEERRLQSRSRDRGTSLQQLKYSIGKSCRGHCLCDMFSHSRRFLAGFEYNGIASR
jgi:hypothetical protein